MFYSKVVLKTNKHLVNLVPYHDVVPHVYEKIHTFDRLKKETEVCIRKLEF
jgi:hypothetical protein